MPLLSQVALNTGLTNFALGYAPQAGRFVANEVFPVIPVMKESGSYRIGGQEHLDDQSARNARHMDGTYARVDHQYSSASYGCVDYGLESLIRDPITDNADAGLDPKQDAVVILREQMLLAQELRVAAALAAATFTSTVDTALTGGNRWDLDTSTPIQNVQTLLDAVQDQSGAPANRLLVNRAVFKALKSHADILDRIKYGGTNTSPANVTAQMLAELFGVERVIVGSAVYNSAKQGQNRSLAQAWGNSVVAFHYPAAIANGVATMGAQFSWREDTGGQDLVVEEYRDDTRRGDVVRCRQYRDEVVVGSLFAARYTTVVS